MATRYYNVFRIAIMDADFFSGFIAGAIVFTLVVSSQDAHVSIIFSILPSAIISAIFLGGSEELAQKSSGEGLLKLFLLGLMTLLVSAAGTLIGWIPIELMGIKDTVAKYIFGGIGSVALLAFLPWFKMQSPEIAFRADHLSTLKDTMHDLEEDLRQRRALERDAQANQAHSETYQTESQIQTTGLNERRLKDHHTTEDVSVIDKNFEISTRFEIIDKLEKGDYTKDEIDRLIENAPYLGLEREDVEKIYRYRYRYRK